MTKRPSMKKAVLTMCHNCTCGWADGKKDCEVTDCPLYFWQGYRKLEPDLEWTAKNPKSIGE